jgi:NAD(P)-dependent dehydrogenase (short-subunit alcohol dehydrogenase family)
MGMVDGKVAIVTGATSGIGTRTVEALIEEGARVVFTGRRAEEGQAIADRLGTNAVFVQADATNESDWRRVGETTMERFGRIVAFSTTPVDLLPRARSPLSRWRGSTTRWHCSCVRSCSA